MKFLLMADGKISSQIKGNFTIDGTSSDSYSEVYCGKHSSRGCLMNMKKKRVIKPKRSVGKPCNPFAGCTCPSKMAFLSGVITGKKG